MIPFPGLLTRGASRCQTWGLRGVSLGFWFLDGGPAMSDWVRGTSYRIGSKKEVRKFRTSAYAWLKQSRYRPKIRQHVWSLLSRVPPDPFDANSAQNGYLTPLIARAAGSEARGDHVLCAAVAAGCAGDLAGGRAAGSETRAKQRAVARPSSHCVSMPCVRCAVGRRAEHG
jgi:hypothetical protein